MKMKKEYKKPVVELVEFEISEAIATCSLLAYNLKGESCTDPNPNFPHLTFQDAAACEGSDPLPDGYCYYTIAEKQTFFNS